MAFRVMRARLWRAARSGAAGNPGDEQFRHNETGLQQRHRRQQYRGRETTGVSYVLRVRHGEMFRHRTNEISKELRRTMCCTVYRFVGGGVPVTKVSRYVDNADVDGTVICLFQDVRDHCRRRTVRCGREQG